MVNQAFDLEKVIAATFDMSDRFRELMRNVPQNYIEHVNRLYSDLLFKAYKGGLKSAEIKIKSTPINRYLDGQDLDHEIDIRMPINYGFKKDLNNAFREETSKYLSTVPDSASEIYTQFGRELENAYRDGVKEFLDTLPDPNAEEEEFEMELEIDFDLDGEDDTGVDVTQDPTTEVEEYEFEEEPMETVDDSNDFDEIINDSEDEEDRAAMETKRKDSEEYFTAAKLVDIMKPGHIFEVKAGKTKYSITVLSVDPETKVISHFKGKGEPTKENLIRKTNFGDCKLKALGHVNFDKKKHESYNWTHTGYIQIDTQAALHDDRLELFRDKASSDLKKLYNEQNKAKFYEANAELVYDFANWVQTGNKANMFIPDVSKVEAHTKKPIKIKLVDTNAEVSNETIKAAEEYTRIPGDSEAEMVLRYTLGLPPKGGKAEKAEASFKSSKIEAGKVVGPYDTQALKGKVLSAVKTHKISDNDLQTVIIDCIVQGVNHMADSDAATAIAKKLGFDDMITDNITLDQVEERADMLAQQLDISFGLPGDTIFLNMPSPTDSRSNDYCLTFNFERKDAPKLSRSTESTTEAAKSAKNKSLPKGPQGVLSKLDQKEIAQLASLGTSRTMKDIRKASAKVASYMKDILTSIRVGRVGISEGTRKLRANMEDVIAEVFGSDGLGFYQYLKTKNK